MSKRKKDDSAPTVTCGECAEFIRDTDGISYSFDNGEYFMGVCRLGNLPDTIRKQFANRPRKCAQWKPLQK